MEAVLEDDIVGTQRDDLFFVGAAYPIDILGMLERLVDAADFLESRTTDQHTAEAWMMDRLAVGVAPQCSRIYHVSYTGFSVDDFRAGVIDELLSCKDLIDSIVREAEQRLSLLALRAEQL